MRNKNVSPHFEDGVIGSTIERYLLTYHWKVLLTIEIIMLSKGFNNISGQNGSLSNFDMPLFRNGLTYTHENCTIFNLPYGLKQCITQKGLKIAST